MPGFTSVVVVTLASDTVAALFLAGIVTSRALAAPAVPHVQVAPPAAKSQVPDVTAPSRFFSPQAVSALDISADGKFITVGTMAFSHDANVWQFAQDGTILARRYFPPWAPMQVATLSGGRALAVGLAYSRVTSPEPTVWFGPTDELMVGNLKDDLAEADSPDGQLARLRPGAGNWRTGWLASSLGELFVRGPDWIFKPEARFFAADGQRPQLRYENKNLLPTSRALRMVSSGDGKRVAFGWLGFSRSVPGLPTHAEAVSVWQVKPNRQVWSASPLLEKPPALPDPVGDFRDSLKDFRLAPDELVPDSFDLTVYKIELGGKRIAFTGDLGFENQDILHRCWGDAAKARALVPVIRDKLLAWRPDIVSPATACARTGRNSSRRCCDTRKNPLGHDRVTSVIREQDRPEKRMRRHPPPDAETRPRPGQLRVVAS